MDSSQSEYDLRLGILSLSTDLLLKMLMLPEGYKVRKAYLNPYGSVLELVVEHKSLPLAVDLEALPQVTPVLRSVLHEGPHYEPELVEIKIEANK